MIKDLLVGQLTWNIPLCLILISISIAYILFLKQNKHSINSLLKPILFFIGISLLYLTIGSPLLMISYLSFSLHMIQMSLLFFIIPPLILLGIPHHMYQSIRERRVMKQISKLMISPQIALLFFATLFLLYHLPFLLTFLSQQAMMQGLYLVVLFGLSFRIVWPIASPDPKQRLSNPKMKKYILYSGLIIMPACLLFIISGLLDGMNNPFLSQLTTHLCITPGTSSIQLLPPPFNTKYDQIMAGIFMIGLHKLGLVFTKKLEAKC